MSGSTQSGDGSTVTQLDPDIKNAWLANNKQAQDLSGYLSSTPPPDQKVAKQDKDTTAADKILNNRLDAGFKQLQQSQALAKDAGNYDPNQVDPSTMQSAQIAPVSDVRGRQVQYLTGDADTAGLAAQAKARQTDYITANTATAGNAADAQKVTENRSNIANVGANGLPSTDLNQYLNPGQQDVIDTTTQDWLHGLDLQKNQDAANAAAAGAFGNSRYGVQQGVTNDAADRTLASTLAGLNQTNYNNATSLAQTDLGRAQTADQSNQAADLSVYGQNSAQKQQTELANAAAQDQRQEFNATAKNTVGLANAQSGNTARLQTAQNQNTANLANAAASDQMAQFNTSAKNAMDLANLGYANTARQQTAANDQQARVLNAAAANTAGLTQAQLDQQAGLANQSTDLTAQQSNQQAGLTANQQSLGASQQLASDAAQRQSMDLTNVGALNNQGSINQTQKQNQLNTAYQNALAQFNMPATALAAAQSSFSNMPTTGSGGTSNSTSSGKGLGI